MDKREIVKLAIEGRKVPYVPWHCGFTAEAAEKLRRHFARDDLELVLDNHFVKLGSDIGFFDELGPDRFRDVFGVVWDRSVDKDIGNVRGRILPEPTLAGYEFPDPLDRRFFDNIDGKLSKYPDCFRVFKIGFSLYERAWTLRGMENLMMDFLDHPDFVRRLLGSIADYNIAQVTEALKYDIDAVYFGDDWGWQRGLQMGHRLWGEFIRPELERMYSVVRGVGPVRNSRTDETHLSNKQAPLEIPERERFLTGQGGKGKISRKTRGNRRPATTPEFSNGAGKYVMLHSCGKVDELFDCLIEIGLNCFNPFQPEVMDVFEIMERYKGRLAFHGGFPRSRLCRTARLKMSKRRQPRC